MQLPYDDEREMHHRDHYGEALSSPTHGTSLPLHRSLVDAHASRSLEAPLLDPSLAHISKSRIRRDRSNSFSRHSHYGPYLDFEVTQHPHNESIRSFMRKFIVIELVGRTFRLHVMKNSELLKYVHCQNEVNKLDDKAVGALKVRDIRQVVSPHGMDRPSIEARRHCILVNLLATRCIIQHNRILLILPNYGNLHETDPGLFEVDFIKEVEDIECFFSSETIRREGPNLRLLQKIRDLTDSKTTEVYEFVALEAILVDVCRRLIEELIPLKAGAQKIVEFIRTEPSSSKRVYEVTDLRRCLDSVSDKVSGVHTALRELLDTDEDIRRMHVTVLWQDPDAWLGSATSPTTEDLELLLECYEQEAESILKSVHRADGALDDALKVVELHMASVRNTFLKSELGLDIVGVVISLVAAVAGLFGMNITTGLEADLSLFWLLTCSLLGLCAFTAVCTFYIFKNMKL